MNFRSLCWVSDENFERITGNDANSRKLFGTWLEYLFKETKWRFLKGGNNEVCCSSTASLHSLTEKPAASSQKHMAEQRQRVVTELINTEKDYCNDLELCVTYFLRELQISQVSFGCTYKWDVVRFSARGMIWDESGSGERFTGDHYLR